MVIFCDLWAYIYDTQIAKIRSLLLIFRLANRSFRQPALITNYKLEILFNTKSVSLSSCICWDASNNREPSTNITKMRFDSRSDRMGRK